MPRVYKELQKVNTKGIKWPIEKWGSELNRQYSKTERKMFNGSLKVLNILSGQGSTNGNNLENTTSPQSEWLHQQI